MSERGRGSGCQPVPCLPASLAAECPAQQSAPSCWHAPLAGPQWGHVGRPPCPLLLPLPPACLLLLLLRHCCCWVLAAAPAAAPSNHHRRRRRRYRCCRAAGAPGQLPPLLLPAAPAGAWKRTRRGTTVGKCTEGGVEQQQRQQGQEGQRARSIQMKVSIPFPPPPLSPRWQQQQPGWPKALARPAWRHVPPPPPAPAGGTWAGRAAPPAHGSPPGVTKRKENGPSRAQEQRQAPPISRATALVSP